MAKCDVSISRNLKINTGNFSSINPGIYLLIKDVDSDKVTEVYTKMASALDSILALEILSANEEMHTIDEIGFQEYAKNLQKMRQKIEENLQLNLKES